MTSDHEIIILRVFHVHQPFRPTAHGYAEAFTAKFQVTCLVYNHRRFGSSDQAPGQPRNEAIFSQQISNYFDAITYLSTRPDVDDKKIGIWGSSFSGGHVLVVAINDRRGKLAMSVVP